MTNPLIPETKPGQARKRNVFDILDAFKAKGETGKNILIRVDFNVPMNDEFTITDDSRIRGALPTITSVLEANQNAILMSHMGRPKKVQKGEDSDGAEREKMSLKHVKGRLSELAKVDVQFVDDCVGNHVKAAVQGLSKEGGQLLLLENLRFHKEEEKNDDTFAKSLSEIADAYVNDAFGTCHRAHASTAGVPALLPKEMCAVGCLVAKEVAFLDFSGLGPDDKIAASKLSIRFQISDSSFIDLSVAHSYFEYFLISNPFIPTLLPYSHRRIKGFHKVASYQGALESSRHSSSVRRTGLYLCQGSRYFDWNFTCRRRFGGNCQGAHRAG